VAGAGGDSPRQILRCRCDIIFPLDLTGGIQINTQSFTFFAIVTLAFTLVGCGSNSVRYEFSAAAVKDRKVVIFVPGFYGTALADKITHERFFLTAYQGLFGSQTLAIATPDLGVPGARDLVPDGVLENVPVVPLIYSQDVYGNAIHFLKDSFGKRAEIIPFAYDWRQDLHQSVVELNTLITRLQESGVSDIYLVGHSLGGVITSYYLRYGIQPPESAVDTGEGATRIRAAVVAGAPYLGVASAFRNFQLGTSLGGAKAPLNQLALSTFPSMYHLMSVTDSGTYRNKHFDKIKQSIYDPKIWEKSGQGFYHDQTGTAEVQQRRAAATANYLARADAFMSRLREPAYRPIGLGKYPLFIYVGIGIPTFARVLWTGENYNSEGEWVYDDDKMHRFFPDLAASSLEADGDGTVPETSAMPPAAIVTDFSPEVLVGNARHEAMFINEGLREGIKKFFGANGL
jgi:pimeloyl-ACP methyl ester carboxylesterase